MEAERSWINGVADERISARDRGLAYGDGLFETMRIVDGRVPLGDLHLERLARGAARLRIELAPGLVGEIDRATDGVADAILKVVITRGAGARGYDPGPPGSIPTRILLRSAHLALLPAHYAAGVVARICQMRLAENSTLAGLKHLNRLEQVLARGEWSEPGIMEGLMCDTSGRLVCATAANVFALIDDTWVTPSLGRCGVEGVARAFILAALSGAHAQVRDMLPTELERAGEVFLSNAVRGIVPLNEVVGVGRWPVGPRTRELMARFAALGLQPECAA